jgi:hypothetical protein
MNDDYDLNLDKRIEKNYRRNNTNNKEIMIQQQQQ